jgi:hypothetical protein
MNAPNISTSSPLPRRTFLRGLGVSLALPALECMTPVFVRAEGANETPRRMLVIVNNLGLLPQNFFPENKGRDYAPSPYLEVLSEQRNDFTVFSGLSHPGVTGAHSTDNCFLTAASGAFKSGFRNSISLDQFAAEKLPQLTRFPTLNLGVISSFEKGRRSLSFTRDGALLPTENSPAALFQKMFIQGNPTAVQEQLDRLRKRGSILDTLTREAGRFSRTLGAGDKDRLDQYLTSVREVEQRLQTAAEWEQRPRPSATQAPPADIRDDKLFFAKFELMLDMAQLIFESDSTRIITLIADAFRAPVFRLPDQKVTTHTYHNLSHHGQNEEKLRELEAADRQHLKLLRRLIGNLGATPEDGRRLLDHTMVLYGSNLGDANIHDCTNLPIVLAGGRFRHGQHLAFKRDHNTPLCNLFVTMLQHLGIEADKFGSSTGAIEI